MRSTDMNSLISQLNNCLTWTRFGVIGLDRVMAAAVLEEWFEWHEKNLLKPKATEEKR